jgi:hypothetical protein
VVGYEVRWEQGEWWWRSRNIGRHVWGRREDGMDARLTITTMMASTPLLIPVVA